MNLSDGGEISIVPSTTIEDREWFVELWRREWGGDTIVSRGREHRPDGVNTLIAFDGSQRIGAASYCVEGTDCELVSINVLHPHAGIGTRLLGAVERRAIDAGCRRIWLITTNDNIDALRFYQRRGFHLIRVFPAAIDESRRAKPSISLIGQYGIPIRDEIEVEKSLR